MKAVHLSLLSAGWLSRRTTEALETRVLELKPLWYKPTFKRKRGEVSLHVAENIHPWCPLALRNKEFGRQVLVSITSSIMLLVSWGGEGTICAVFMPLIWVETSNPICLSELDLYLKTDGKFGHRRFALSAWCVVSCHCQGREFPSVRTSKEWDRRSLGYNFVSVPPFHSHLSGREEKSIPSCSSSRPCEECWLPPLSATCRAGGWKTSWMITRTQRCKLAHSKWSPQQHWGVSTPQSCGSLQQWERGKRRLVLRRRLIDFK